MSHIPIRTCVACRRARPKDELVRIVRRRDGSVVADPSGREPGRGAYICPERDCVAAAEGRGASRVRHALRGANEHEVVAALESVTVRSGSP